jgi:predicted nucleic acid-binding protein
VIVVDTNVLAYLVLPGEHTLPARAALRRDPHWAAPLLWRSELRNVLAGYLRRGALTIEQAAEMMQAVAAVLKGGELMPDTTAVLRLVTRSRCSAYDCEFVALARELGAPLVTSDQRILAEFPETAVALREFGGEG